MGYVVIFTLKQVGISSNYIFKEWAPTESCRILFLLSESFSPPFVLRSTSLVKISRIEYDNSCFLLLIIHIPETDSEQNLFQRT